MPFEAYLFYFYIDHACKAVLLFNQQLGLVMSFQNGTPSAIMAAQLPIELTPIHAASLLTSIRQFLETYPLTPHKFPTANHTQTPMSESESCSSPSGDRTPS
jgi:hypothetical protein